MAESRGRPGSHGPGGRNSNNNGRGNQGPGGGNPSGGGDKDYNKSKPSVGRHNVKGYSHQSFGPQGLDAFGKGNGYDKLTEQQRRRVAKFRSPFAAFMHRFGSFFVPGVDSYLSIDPKTGKLASVDEFDAVGMATGMAATGQNPIGSTINTAYKAAKGIGFGAPTYTSTRTLDSFKNGSQGPIGGGGAFSGSGGGSGGNTGPNPERDSGSNFNSSSLFERAQQTLYPQQTASAVTDEEKLQLGVDVSQGKSRVRRAPRLSVLNVRRPTFGRVGG